MSALLTVAQVLFVLAALLLALPVAVFVLEVVLSLTARRSTGATLGAARAPLAVLVPAHNEGAGILATLASVRSQLIAGDRLLVVADNCSDDTAEQARGAGAEVLVRTDLVQRGKGFALDAGVRELAKNPPTMVVVVDADCMLGPQALDTLAQRCAASGRPVQALYLMRAPGNAGLKTRIAEFAWAVKNRARALGLARIGQPCQLMGSGMAFPWTLIEGAALASADLVEDLRLGLDFARARQAPVFCPEALVTSEFPINATGLQSQRTRWEHGHLAIMLRDGPRLLLEGLRARNAGLVALTLDMCVPPLALLVLVSLALGALGALIWAITGAALPWALALPAPLLLGLAVLAAWVRFGRTILSGRELAYAPVYALVKIPLYLKFVVQRQVAWVRSERDPS
ncbi:glycosyltransferase family 2 protein [Massilia sp. CF038]|uniref:glycosyltransferase family 2 protein n=1 Tax=Massilia sp. CF038 TaxID=1881045 RepID=UPI0009157AB3|nr:glycosyltransferase family 2 protein [Massilia sp. CF038]SHH11772.1 Glycosyltransferase, catalytic subunit of cellulose synthase and poly-beta-1,6-N-acetylglucosamine synthase [Massilia sp. CF038]